MKTDNETPNLGPIPDLVGHTRPSDNPPPPPAPTQAPPPAGGGGGGGGGGSVPAYNQDTGPFGGRGVFTSSDPLSALQFAGTVSWVAVRPDQCTPDQVAQLKAAGFQVVVWQDSATIDGAAFAAKYADGYIAQAEGPDELAAANGISATLGNMPKALVSNNFMSSYPPGWIAMPEAYTNDNPNATVDRVIADAQTRGAKTIIPIVGTYGGGYSAQNYLGTIAGLGLGSYGAFSVEAMSPQDVQAWNSPTAPLPKPGKQDFPPPAAPQGRSMPGAGGGLGGAYAPVGSPYGPTSTGAPYGPPRGGGGGALSPPLGPGKHDFPPGTGGGGSGGGGGGGGKGKGGGTAQAGSSPWDALFSSWGLPPEVMRGLDQILRQYADPQQAAMAGLAYLRGTSWYAQTYPGIADAFKHGLVSDEAGYRQMLNEVNVQTLNYLGRPVGGEEFANYLRQGYNTEQIAKLVGGQAYANTYGNDIQSLLGAFGPEKSSQEDMNTIPGSMNAYGAAMNAYGAEKMGLDTSVGMNMQRLIDQALERYRGAFSGVAAPPRGLTVGGAGLAAPEMLGTKVAGNDVGAL